VRRLSQPFWCRDKTEKRLSWTWHQRQKRIYSFTDEQIYFFKTKTEKLNYLKHSRFEK